MLHAEGAQVLQQMLRLPPKAIHVQRDPREMLYHWAKAQAPSEATGVMHLIRKNARWAAAPVLPSLTRSRFAPALSRLVPLLNQACKFLTALMHLADLF